MAKIEDKAIISINYDETHNYYTTQLKDGTPGPNISLDQMYTMKQAKEAAKDLNAAYAKYKQFDSEVNSYNMGKVKPIKDDMTNYIPKIKLEIKKLKSKISGS